MILWQIFIRVTCFLSWSLCASPRHHGLGVGKEHFPWPWPAPPSTSLVSLCAAVESFLEVLCPVLPMRDVGSPVFSG